MRGERWERIWLWAGVAVPFIYYGNAADDLGLAFRKRGTSLPHPCYSDYAQRLGGHGAAQPAPVVAYDLL